MAGKRNKTEKKEKKAEKKAGKDRRPAGLAQQQTAPIDF